MAKAAQGGKRSGDRGKSPAAKDPELVAFGGRLLALRVEAGLTQEALAEAAGLHWTYVGQIERAERNFSYKNLLKLARGLGVEPARLLPSSRN
jgi:transcriptional regulator with XRE-family HTH domain